MVKAITTLGVLSISLASQASARYLFEDGTDTVVLTTPSFVTSTQIFNASQVDFAQVALSDFQSLGFYFSPGNDDEINLSALFLGLQHYELLADFQPGSFSTFGVHQSTQGLQSTLTVSYISNVSNVVPAPSAVLTFILVEITALRKRRQH